MGKLRGELKQTKPFSGLREEAMLNIWRTGDFLAQHRDTLLKTSRISQNQYNVLRILRGAGSDGLPSGEIASRMLTHDPDITRLMDRLVRRGLARRTRVRHDRRVVLARITPAGLAILAELDPLIVRFENEIMSPLRNPQLATLISLLEQLRGSE